MSGPPPRDTRGALGTRPLSLSASERLGVAGFLAYALPGVIAAVSATVAPRANDHRAAAYVVAVLTFAGGLSLLAISRRAARLLSMFALVLHFYLFLATALITAYLWTLDLPKYDLVATFYCQVAGFAFFMLRRAWAAVHVALVGIGYAFAISTSADVTNAPVKWALLMAAVSAIGYTLGISWENADDLAAKLADLNASLEQRVAEQVEETTRLGRLRRFLSPQVADAVLHDQQVLLPHRRQIAVVFCDLRGFTRFVSGAEPEDVADVLHDYYDAIGRLVREYDATVGVFAGDGVMVYFNDPVPCPDPPGRALDFALSLRDPLRALGERWRGAGVELGYGVGVAFGYATLGTIGFEGRHDYTPVGSVVNLASRLCDEAGDGEVLLDRRMHDAVRDRVASEPCQVHVKGFHEPVTAYRVPTLAGTTTLPAPGPLA